LKNYYKDIVYMNLQNITGLFETTKTTLFGCGACNGGTRRKKMKKAKKSVSKKNKRGGSKKYKRGGSKKKRKP
tara:strand:- start:1785 stop:2003 length:219 start_codon:yes stop_codon:yes gene_type:complete